MRLNIVVEKELMGMRTQVDRIHFFLGLVADPFFDDVRGKDIALQQELMVGLEGGQGFRQRSRRGGDFSQLLRRQAVDVFVQG